MEEKRVDVSLDLDVLDELMVKAFEDFMASHKEINVFKITFDGFKMMYLTSSGKKRLEAKDLVLITREKASSKFEQFEENYEYAMKCNSLLCQSIKLNTKTIMLQYMFLSEEDKAEYDEILDSFKQELTFLEGLQKRLNDARKEFVLDNDFDIDFIDSRDLEEE